MPTGSLYSHYPLCYIKVIIVIKLVERKLPNIEESRIILIINNIRKYLIGRIDYEINQCSTGMKVLFRENTIRV